MAFYLPVNFIRFDSRSLCWFWIYSFCSHSCCVCVFFSRCAISLCILCYVSLNIPFATFKANTDLQWNTQKNVQEIERKIASGKNEYKPILKQNSTKRNGRENNWNVLYKNNCKREMKPQTRACNPEIPNDYFSYSRKFNQNEIKSNTNTNKMN